MSILEDNPINPDRDKTEVGIMRRYNRATELAIIMSDRTTFEALCDIPDMLDTIKRLTKELEVAKLGV